MRRYIFLLLAALAVCLAARPATGQKFQPKSIRFDGDPEYSDQEMFAAAGLKKGAVLSYSDMQDYSKRLLGSGVFASVAFKFDGLDLTFMLVPNSDLCTVHLENIPLTPGSELDAKIHAEVPLYHGKVPSDGGINDDVRAALEKLLVKQGLQASVVAATGADPATHKVNSVGYSISNPPVRVSVIKIDGASADLQPKLDDVIAEASKSPFSTGDSVTLLQRTVEQFYNDRGYAAAKIEVAQTGSPALQAGAIAVPFSIRIVEGRVYQVAAIHLPAGTPVTPDEIDKILHASQPSIGPSECARFGV